MDGLLHGPWTPPCQRHQAHPPHVPQGQRAILQDEVDPSDPFSHGPCW